MKSYRPVSNLTFIGKFLERFAINRLREHTGAHCLFPVQHFELRLRSGTAAASTSRGRAVCPGFAATGRHHSCTADTTLASGASTYYLLVVHTDAWCCLRCAPFYPLYRCCRTTLDVTRKSTSVVCRQLTVRHTTGVIVGRFQRFRRCGSASLESATHISSPNGLCRDIQAPYGPKS